MFLFIFSISILGWIHFVGFLVHQLFWFAQVGSYIKGHFLLCNFIGFSADTINSPAVN